MYINDGEWLINGVSPWLTMIILYNSIVMIVIRMIITLVIMIMIYCIYVYVYRNSMINGTISGIWYGEKKPLAN